MDPPPPSSATNSSSKLRLMCSYGGHIIPRPHTKSLYYAGGDTRIITVPSVGANSSTLSLSALNAHLASVLHISNPFTLKYQLPSHDLDSLISVSTDEDLLIMLDEHHRLSPTRSRRIRLFLFPVSEKTQLLRHPKTETWFVDALKSAKIMQKGGGGGGVGFGGEGQCDGGEGSVGGFNGPESVVMETSSSFGSTSSSASLSNLPAKGSVEDTGTALQDNKVKLSESDNGVPTAVSQLQAGTCQETVVSLPLEGKVSPKHVELEIGQTIDAFAPVEMQKAVQSSGFPLSLLSDQPQHAQVIHAGPAPVQYVPQNSPGMMPMSSYYVMNPTVPQQQFYYPTNQPQPIYLIPIAQPYNLPVQGGLVNTPTVASTHPQVHPNSNQNPAQVVYKVASASPMAELGSQAYRKVQMASPLVDVPHNENVQGAVPNGVTPAEAGNYGNELDDPARALIYKSQPPAPILPSQYQTMTNATTLLLSGAFAQLHTDNTKQQLRPSQPQ